MKRVAVSAAVVLAVFGAILGAVTLVALEGVEVVVVRTFDAAGTPRETRTWVADTSGAMLIEAANPDRPFLRDVRTQPRVELRRGSAWRKCRAYVQPNPAGHARIRKLLAERYGWADRWIGLLADTRASSAIRLECEP